MLVNRLTQIQGGAVTNFIAEIQIFCDECGVPFKFLAPCNDVSLTTPTIGTMGDKLRAPIKPHDGKFNAKRLISV